MTHRIQVDGRDQEAQIIARRPHLTVRLGDRLHTLEVGESDAHRFSLVVDGVTHTGWRCSVGNDLQVRMAGRTYTVHFVRREHKQGGAAGQEELRASMPGVVVAIHCAAGQPVSTGDKLLTLESMKLQMTIVAPHEGIIAGVHVKPEAVFERGALLVSFAPPEQGTP